MFSLIVFSSLEFQITYYLTVSTHESMNFCDSGSDLQVVNFILQTIDPSNSVLRKACFQSSWTTFKEVVRVYPMVAVNESWTRLAVGDVIGEVNNASIRVYDMQRYQD